MDATTSSKALRALALWLAAWVALCASVASAAVVGPSIPPSALEGRPRPCARFEARPAPGLLVAGARDLPVAGALDVAGERGEIARAGEAEVAKGCAFAWQAHLYDADVGLILARARVIDPITGVYLQRDPSGFSDSTNLYAVDANAPTLYRDPTGRIVDVLVAASRCALSKECRAFWTARRDDLAQGTDVMNRTVAEVAAGAGNVVAEKFGSSVAPESAALVATAVQFAGSALLAGPNLLSLPAAVVRAPIDVSEGAERAISGAQEGRSYLAWKGVAQLAGGVGTLAGAVAIVAPKPQARAYSVAYEAEIPRAGVGTRGAHFKAANEILLDEMKASPDFASTIESLGIDVPTSKSGTALGESPKDWTWHHLKDRPGVLQLVPRVQHAGSLWQRLLHPESEGGFKLWGDDY